MLKLFFKMPKPMLYYDDEDGDGSPESVGFIEDDHPLQLHGNRELAAQAVKLLQVPSRPGDASFTSSTTDMDVPIYVKRGSSAANLGNKVMFFSTSPSPFHSLFSKIWLRSALSPKL